MSELIKDRMLVVEEAAAQEAEEILEEIDNLSAEDLDIVRVEHVSVNV